jgi:hypothetical protein
LLIPELSLHSTLRRLIASEGGFAMLPREHLLPSSNEEVQVLIRFDERGGDLPPISSLRKDRMMQAPIVYTLRISPLHYRCVRCCGFFSENLGSNPKPH